MEPETINDRLLAAGGRFSYREIGDLTGMHPETVRRYMNGDPPSPEFLAAFCAGMGISADWMLFARGPMSSATAIRKALAWVSEESLFAGLAKILAPASPPDQYQGAALDGEHGLNRATAMGPDHADPGLG